MGVAGRGETIHLEAPGQRPVELLFVLDGTTMYVVASGVNSPWVSAALKVGRAIVHAGPGRVEVRGVSLVKGALEEERARVAFREKYGEEKWGRYFSASYKVLSLIPNRVTVPRSRDDLVREEFDSVAAFYHDRVEANPFEVYLKNQSRAELRTLFRGEDPLLEIGSGTGIETLPLLLDGHRVTAVDLSPNMLRELRTRAHSNGVADRLTTIEGSLGALSEVLRSVSDGTFRGAFSTFGAMNLEPNLAELPKTLARLLSPGARFFTAILNRLALLPPLYEVLASGPRGILARLPCPIPAGGIRYPLDVFPRNPFSFSRMFSDRFFLDSIRAASVLAPPFPSAHLFDFWGKRGRHRLAEFDLRLAKSSAGVWLGEWVFVTLRRR